MSQLVDDESGVRVFLQDIQDNLYVVPVKSSDATTDLRHGNHGETWPEGLNGTPEGLVDPLQPSVWAWTVLGGKVEDVPFFDPSGVVLAFPDEGISGGEILVLALELVPLEHLGVPVLELLGNPSTHHPEGVAPMGKGNTVLGIEKVALALVHGLLLPGLELPFSNHLKGGVVDFPTNRLGESDVLTTFSLGHGPANQRSFVCPTNLARHLRERRLSHCNLLPFRIPQRTHPVLSESVRLEQ